MLFVHLFCAVFFFSFFFLFFSSACSIMITSLGEETVILCAFRAFVLCLLR